MAHLAKFEGGIVGKKMYQHWAREVDEKGEYATYNRADGGGHIDRNRTKDNFTIGNIHDREWVKKRLENVYQKPGHKNNNIIGAWVHMDEAQPHMHFAFLPISERVSKQKPEYKEKLSTRAYWPSKNSLQKMHDTLQKDMDEGMGRHILGIYDGRTKDQGGNKSIATLKKETAEQKERLERLKTKPEELKELKGELVKPLLGEEHYKLTPYQYKRLRTLAQNSIQEHDDNVILEKKNTELEQKNAELQTWVNHYIRKNKKEALEALDEAGKRTKEENNLLKEENDRLNLENADLSEKNLTMERNLGKLKQENALMDKFIKSSKLTQEFRKFSGKNAGLSLGGRK